LAPAITKDAAQHLTTGNQTDWLARASFEHADWVPKHWHFKIFVCISAETQAYQI
jgi:hypothetical protein